MNPLYHFFRAIWWVIVVQTIRFKYINRSGLRRQKGGFIVAVTHLAHLEFVFAGWLTMRDIHWLTRKEFFVPGPITWLLRAVNCIKINRQGIPVAAIRTAVKTAKAGHIVGIFPEGGVVKGGDLAVRGAPIKRGACSISIHSQKPVVPCVILGTEKLNNVGPWLPFWRGKIWIAVGDPITPPQRSTRQTRHEMNERVRQAFQSLYLELQQKHGVNDSDVP